MVEKRRVCGDREDFPQFSKVHYFVKSWQSEQLLVSERANMQIDTSKRTKGLVHLNRGNLLHCFGYFVVVTFHLLREMA